MTEKRQRYSSARQQKYNKKLQINWTYIWWTENRLEHWMFFIHRSNFIYFNNIHSSTEVYRRREHGVRFCVLVSQFISSAAKYRYNRFDDFDSVDGHTSPLTRRTVNSAAPLSAMNDEAFSVRWHIMVLSLRSLGETILYSCAPHYNNVQFVFQPASSVCQSAVNNFLIFCIYDTRRPIAY